MCVGMPKGVQLCVSVCVRVSWVCEGMRVCGLCVQV